MPLLPDSDQILVTASRFSIGTDTNDEPNHSSIAENFHFGWLIVTNLQQELLYCTPGADKTSTFFRSSAKPFQAFPLVEKGYDAALSEEELAIACASHTGSQRHIDLAESILKKAGLTEDHLQCGPQTPTDKAIRKQMETNGEEPRRIHNNCSGKHAGMLLYCTKSGLDTDNYLDASHGLQKHIVNIIREWGNYEEIELAIDGCGAPVFYLPLKNMALLYAQLGSNPIFRPICKAMSAYPEVVGGAGRIDTAIMQASQEKLVAKVGADGVFCVARIGTGEGLALKIADGTTEIRDTAIIQILLQLGWIDDTMRKSNYLSSYLNRTTRYNTQGKAVGKIKVHFQARKDQCQ